MVGNDGSPARRWRRGVTAMGERRARRSAQHDGGPGNGAVGEAAVGARHGREAGGMGEAVGTQRRGRQGTRSASGEREALSGRGVARSRGGRRGRGGRNAAARTAGRVVGERRARGDGLARGVLELLVRWTGQAAADATWVELGTFMRDLPSFQLEDELVLHGGRDVMTGIPYRRRGQRQPNLPEAK
jgi:hypothetical protein